MKDLKNLITTILFLLIIAAAAYLTRDLWLPQITRIVPKEIISRSAGKHCDTSQSVGLQAWMDGNDCQNYGR